MISIDTGEKIELHKDNVKFQDATIEIIVDSGTETWIDADRVSYYWIHRGIWKRIDVLGCQRKPIIRF